MSRQQMPEQRSAGLQNALHALRSFRTSQLTGSMSRAAELLLKTLMDPTDFLRNPEFTFFPHLPAELASLIGEMAVDTCALAHRLPPAPSHPEKEFELISQALRCNSALRSFEVSMKCGDDAVLVTLGGLLAEPSCQLRELKVASAGAQQSSIMKFLGSLGTNQRLKTLHLTDWTIRKEAMVQLGSLFSLRTTTGSMEKRAACVASRSTEKRARALRSLGLESVFMGPATVRALSDILATRSGLTQLTLLPSSKVREEQQLAMLLPGLRVNETLERFHVRARERATPLLSALVGAFIRGPRDPVSALSSLSIRGTTLKLQLATTIRDLLCASVTLKSVNLENCRLSNSNARVLSEGLSAVRSLRELICTGSRVDDDGLLSIVRGVARNPYGTLEKLSCSRSAALANSSVLLLADSIRLGNDGWRSLRKLELNLRFQHDGEIVPDFLARVGPLCPLSELRISREPGAVHGAALDERFLVRLLHGLAEISQLELFSCPTKLSPAGNDLVAAWLESVQTERERTGCARLRWPLTVASTSSSLWQLR